MLDSLFAILPVFALIAVGWIGRRSNALGPTATREVNRLVVNLALPALLFDIVASASPEALWQPGFIAAFSAGCAVVFGASVIFAIWRGRHAADASIEGLNASYANTGYVAFPLVLALVGPIGLPLTLIAAVLTVCALFGFAIVVIESALQSGSRLVIVGNTLLALARNPLLVAPVLGALVMLSGIALPAPVEGFLDLLGGAAAPCALIALGLFLADDDGTSKVDNRLVAQLVGLKLLVQPAVTWVVAVPILALPQPAAYLVVLLAALPTGTGPFMLAQKYERGAALTARVVLASTVLSVATLTAYLAIAGLPTG